MSKTPGRVIKEMILDTIRMYTELDDSELEPNTIYITEDMADILDAEEPWDLSGFPPQEYEPYRTGLFLFGCIIVIGPRFKVAWEKRHE
jgi:hypothetical protein